MKFWAYFLIPVYTVLFTRGYNWFTTNFSVIGNFFDKKRSFFLWGVLVGSFFYISHRKVKSRLTLNPVCGRMVPAALALLFFAITTPYLPEELPLKSVLHIIFAFLSALLVLLFLLLVIWSQYQIYPHVYRRYLYGSALEIYVTLTSAAMAERLTCRIARQAALKGRETSCVGYAKLES